jgi:ribosomal protein S18 acetylase RimI-like enzyme
MEIIRVNTPQDLKEFIALPYALYKDDPVWVAPLRSEQQAQFVPEKNPMLNHCTYALFLAKEKGKCVGRISAFLDHLALEHWKQPIGLFGSFECINDPAAANALLSAARDWLREKGMQQMRGPWSFASQEWGLVVEGFEPSPVILAPYNPPYYNDLLSSFGLTKAKDLMVYVIDAREGYTFPVRYLELTDKVQKRYGVTVRPVNMKNLEADVVTITDLANNSISDNWGFYPVTTEEARTMAHDLKQIINPKTVLIAETADGHPIGFAMTLPDINVILKGLNGSLLPFGWLKMLTQLPRITQYRMWALGVIPEYQGKAIDTLLYRATYEAIYAKNIRLEINYVLEDNDRMNNALYKLGVRNLRRYRVYEKLIE